MLQANYNINFVYPCVSTGFGTNINCSNINLYEVRTAFHNADNDIFRPLIVLLSPLAEEEGDFMINIPEDVLGIHCVIIVVIIDCSNHPLRVHLDAFRLSGECTPSLEIKKCDLNSTDFGFLEHFGQLNFFQIESCNHVDLALWSTVPLLANLSEISMVGSSSLNNWTHFPHLTRALLRVTLSSSDIDNVAMDRILRWISNFSANSLTHLWISQNSLTRIPQPLSLFTVLNTLDMNNQAVPGLGSIPTGALRLSSPNVQQLNLQDCGIETIDPGAIQGVFQSQIIKSI